MNKVEPIVRLCKHVSLSDESQSAYVCTVNDDDLLHVAASKQLAVCSHVGEKRADNFEELFSNQRASAVAVTHSVSLEPTKLLMQKDTMKFDRHANKRERHAQTIGR